MLITSIIITFILLLSIFMMMLSLILSKKPFQIEKNHHYLNVDLIVKDQPDYHSLYDFSHCSNIPDLWRQNRSNYISYSKFIQSFILIIDINFFIMILLLGFYQEWKQGALQWAE